MGSHRLSASLTAQMNSVHSGLGLCPLQTAQTVAVPEVLFVAVAAVAVKKVVDTEPLAADVGVDLALMAEVPVAAAAVGAVVAVDTAGIVVALGSVVVVCVDVAAYHDVFGVGFLNC